MSSIGFQNTMTNWMWVPEWEKENQSRCHLVYFRKTFVICEVPKSFQLRISADDRLARKCMDDFRRSVREHGMINCSYPNYESNIIPGFSIYYIMMLYDHMMYFGDSEFLRKHMEAINGILGFFDRNIDGRGLVGKVGGMNGKGPYWSFIDWTIQWDATTGMPAAVKKYCMDEEGMLTDGPGIAEYSQHCQVFAILTDTVSLENGKKNLHGHLEMERSTRSVRLRWHFICSVLLRRWDCMRRRRMRGICGEIW